MLQIGFLIQTMGSAAAAKVVRHGRRADQSARHRVPNNRHRGSVAHRLAAFDSRILQYFRRGSLACVVSNIGIPVCMTVSILKLDALSTPGKAFLCYWADL